MSTCLVVDCGRPPRRRGLCDMHSQRVKHHGHTDRSPQYPTAEHRIRAWVAVDLAGCWLWTGYRRPDGYGELQADGQRILAHRFSYETHVGPVPDGLVIDHLCRVPACINPGHLQPVPQRINVLRGMSPPALCAVKTHCLRGHEFTADNTYLTHRGWRYCRACKRLRARKAAR